MYKVSIITVFFLSGFLCHAQQGLYYDALFFRDELLNADDKIPKTDIDNKELQVFFKKYSLLRANNTLDSGAFAANPFLDQFYPEGGLAGLGSFGGLNAPAFVSSISGLNVTNFADGLAKFLVERTKQELTTTFFQRFHDELEKVKQLQILFPASYGALRAIDKQIYNYAAYIDLLRESFQKDLALMLPHVRQLINDESMAQLFTKYPAIRVILSDALFIVDELNNSRHPGEAIHTYVTVEADSASCASIHKYLYPSLKILDLFSESLRSRQADQYWVSRDSLQLLFKDETMIKVYMGLIYQKITQDQIFFDNTSLTTIFSEFDESVTELDRKIRPYLTGMIEKGKIVDQHFRGIKQIQEAENDTPYQEYYGLYNASLNFLEHLTQGPEVFALNPLNRYDAQITKYFAAARGMGNIYVDITEKQYASAVVELGSLYELLITPQAKAELEDVINKIKNEADGAKKQLLELQRQALESMQKAGIDIVKYGGFMAAMAKAENSDQVQEAIEAVALPAGSARIKRLSSFNVALNGYVGLYLGNEKINKIDTEFKSTFGLSAPVGISISRGHSLFFIRSGGKDWFNGFSSSLFISIIDIGALASFRFTETNVPVAGDTTTATVYQVPEIQLKDIISPGAFVSIGIPKSPISLNMGVQIGPNLRKVSIADDPSAGVVNEYSERMYTRWSVGLVVDIPILNFYSKPKKE